VLVINFGFPECIATDVPGILFASSTEFYASLGFLSPLGAFPAPSLILTPFFAVFYHTHFGSSSSSTPLAKGSHTHTRTTGISIIVQQLEAIMQFHQTKRDTLPH